MRTSLLFLLSLAICRITVAQDPAKLAPQFYRVVLDNEDARVIDYHLRPGEKEPMHSHPSGVLAYYFTDARMRVTLPDGKTAVTANRAGDIIWRDPVTHFAENIGSNEVHTMLVEPKVTCNPRLLPFHLRSQAQQAPMYLCPHALSLITTCATKTNTCMYSK